MADSPNKTLRRTMAGLLDSWSLAYYTPGATIPERGIRLDGVMPVLNEFTLLTSLPPVADGRADMTYRMQIYTRRIGSPQVAEDWADDLMTRLDQREYTPRVLGISWSWEFSRLNFDPDTQGRSAVACTYYFRGRRG